MRERSRVTENAGSGEKDVEKGDLNIFMHDRIIEKQLIAEFITGSSLAVSVSPDVGSITRPQDPLKSGQFFSERKYLFEKGLSKHRIQIYREAICGSM